MGRWKCRTWKCRTWNWRTNMQGVKLQDMQRQSRQEAQLLLGDRATRKHAKDSWNGRENDNLGWNDLQMYFKVITSGTNRKLVYAFLLVVYSNFCRITHRFWEFDVKQSNDLEICPMSLTVVSPESCRVAMYVKCSKDSERKKRKSPFSTTPISFDAPSPTNPPRIYA